MTYEHYAKIRDYYNLKDANVATKSGIPRSTFSDWKKGSYEPKLEKLQKIADVFGISMELFQQPIGKFGQFVPYLREKSTNVSDKETELLNLFRNAEESYKQDVIDLLKKHQKKEICSESLKEA